MNTPDIQPKEDLEARIKKLEELLAEHQHLGLDGSRKFDGFTEMNCSEIEVSGVGIQRHLFAVPFFRAYDVDNLSEKKRRMSMAVGVLGEKDVAGEQNTCTMQIGKGEAKIDSRVEDWNENNFSQLTLVHRPIGSPGYLSAYGKNMSVASFLLARRTPIVFGKGLVSGNTITDTNAKFKPGKSPSRDGSTTGDTLVHGILNLQTEARAILESNVILEVTENQIICENEFSLQGEYNYEVVMPVILGTANVPFSLGYFGDGLVFGYGVRSRNNISSLTFGEGTPEGKITANIGSIYLRQDGGAGTTLYIKEAGTNNNTGWAAK